MADRRTITMTVNGQTYTRDVETRMLLADFLRHEIDLTGTHVGCEHGVCGACTIHVDGQAARSCLMLAVQADGRSLTTVEGLGEDGSLNGLQQAFRDHHALQCGFCTPGMLMTLSEYLKENPAPSEDDLRIVMTGNLCRCTGYQAIVDAALAAAAKMNDRAAGGK